MIKTVHLKKKLRKLNVAKTFKLIWSISRALTTLSLLVILIENLCFIASAFIFKNLINEIAHLVVNNAHKMQLITSYLIGYFTSIVMLIIAKALSSYIGELQGAKVNEFIDGKIHESAVGLDLAFYESPAYFDTLKRARDAGTDRPLAIVNTMVELAKTVSMAITLGYIIFSISWVLIVVPILCSIPGFLVRLKISGKMHDRRLAQTAKERFTAYLSSLIIGDASAKEIRGYGLGNHLKKTYLDVRLALLSERLSISRRGLVNTLISDLFGVLGFLACIAFICYDAVLGRITVGDITIFLVVFPQMFTNLQNVSSSVNKLFQDNIFLAQLFKLFELKPTLTERSNPVAIPSQTDLILEVENLNFSYPSANRLVLSNVNLKIPKGKMIAIVGLNGAGKTTLIKLLCRLYDPSSGCIKIGGTDIREFEILAYRKCVSTVFQDFVRYNVSVADNIRYGDIDASRPFEDIVSAAVAAGANTYIDKFADKYETIMGRIFEHGHEISTGQWQKLAIARALYRPSQFIIFDEATSALDAKAEMELFDSLRESIGHRGALIISHRLSAVQHADYIYVMADGRIVQAGTHKELMDSEGDYATLFAKGAKHHNPLA